MLAYNNDAEPDRVRANTAPHINQSIDKKIEENVRYYSDATTSGNPLSSIFYPRLVSR
jgi:hypothetical protein